MSTLLASLYNVVVDNPIVTKDASLVLRRRRTLAVWVLTAIAIAVACVIVVVDNAGSLRWYGTLDPVGDDLLLVITGIALGAVSLLVPALASSSIAGEREHGTLPLLLVTGLSPLHIVVGKLLAVLIIVAPFVALALPPLGYATVLLGVEVVDVVIAGFGIAAATVAAASVGVYVSAITSRARAAAPGALLASVVPGLLCAMPAFAAVVSQNEGREPLRQVAVGGIVMAAAISVAAVYGAWSALAPRVVPRFALSTRLFLGLVFGVAACGHALIASTPLSDLHVSIGIPAVLWFLVVGLVYVSSAACDRRAPAAWLLVPGALLVGVLAAAMTLSALPPQTRIFKDADMAPALIAFMQVLAGGGLIALAARLRPVPVFAGLAGGGVLFGLMMVPVLLHELGPARPLRFLNFATANDASLPFGLVFWGLLSVGALVAASVGRRPA